MKTRKMIPLEIILRMGVEIKKNVSGGEFN
jgi:hypothetical protein